MLASNPILNKLNENYEEWGKPTDEQQLETGERRQSRNSPFGVPSHADNERGRPPAEEAKANSRGSASRGDVEEGV